MPSSLWALDLPGPLLATAPQGPHCLTKALCPNKAWPGVAPCHLRKEGALSDLQAGWGRSGIERACGFLFEGTCAFGLGGLTRSRNVVIAGNALLTGGGCNGRHDGCSHSWAREELAACLLGRQSLRPMLLINPRRVSLMWSTRGFLTRASFLTCDRQVISRVENARPSGFCHAYS